MKQTLCIAVITLHLLNSVGGYWLFHGLQQHRKARHARELDLGNYAGSQAITIKLPLAQPVSDKENYERVDGEFEFEGIVYRLIKQKFYRDTAYIVCYRDETSIALNDALKDYVNSFTDNASENKSGDKTTGLFVKDYVHNDGAFLLLARAPVEVISDTRYLATFLYQAIFSVDRPPALIS